MKGTKCKKETSLICSCGYCIECQLEHKIDLARHKGDLVTGNKLFEKLEKLRGKR